MFGVHSRLLQAQREAKAKETVSEAAFGVSASTIARGRSAFSLSCRSTKIVLFALQRDRGGHAAGPALRQHTRTRCPLRQNTGLCLCIGLLMFRSVEIFERLIVS